MQEALLQLRLAVVRTVASQKRTQQQYAQAQAQAEADQWQQRIQLALQKGDENLARQALIEEVFNLEWVEKQLGASQFCKNTRMRSPMAEYRE
jgi:phage shock protein A